MNNQFLNKELPKAVRLPSLMLSSMGLFPVSITKYKLDLSVCREIKHPWDTRLRSLVLTYIICENNKQTNPTELLSVSFTKHVMKISTRQNRKTYMYKSQSNEFTLSP